VSDGWSGILPTVVTSGITSVVTIIIAGLGSRYAARRAALKYPLFLYQGTAQIWRLRNDTKRPLLGVEYGLVDQNGNFRIAIEHAGDLAAGDSLHIGDARGLWGVELGDTLLLAWRSPNWFTKRPLRTAEIRTHEGVFEYPTREGSLTYGWTYSSTRPGK
jgi:hypothetical protein